ncbi:MAG: PAS domain-containing protein [Actinomycetota bacterium]
MSPPSLARRSLVGRFAVGSLAVFLLTAGVVSAVMIRDVRRGAEAQATFHAHFTTDAVVASLLTPADLAAPIRGARYQELRSIIEDRIFTDGDVLRIKVWNADGTVLFSDEPALVGRSFPGEVGELRDVMAGRPDSQVTDLSAPENVLERPLADKLFSTYVPLSLEPGGPSVGVVEIYQDYSSIQRQIDTLVRSLAIAFILGLVALYAALLPIARRAARELRHQNAKLQETEAMYRSLVEQIPTVVYIAELGSEGAWLYISGQIRQMLGYTPEEWLAHPHPFATHLHPDDREVVQTLERQASESGEPYRAEYRMRTRDGRTIWIEDRAEMVRDGSGTPLFMQGLMADVTAYKQAEVELAGALESEREGAARLRELDEMKNMFLQAVSHELRTPLAKVLGISLTLEQSDLEITPAERRDFLVSLAKGARQLDSLLSDLLDVDRLARGVIAPKRREVDVGALVQRLIREWDLPDDRPVVVDVAPLVVSVEAAKVERIVENLLTNVVRHTPEGTPVWIRTQASADGVLITVEDAGPGVPASFTGSVFEPFTRGAEVRAWSPGMGIGLSLVARFAELHGGRAWVEHREGGGASFKVRIPGPSGDTRGADPSVPVGPGVEPLSDVHSPV